MRRYGLISFIDDDPHYQSKLSRYRSRIDSLLPLVTSLLDKIPVIPDSLSPPIDFSSPSLETIPEFPFPTMAAFDFSIGLKLPVLSNDRKFTAVRDFLDTILSYYSTLADPSKILLLKFVLSNRIQGSAKSRLADFQVEDTTTFDEFSGIIFARCTATESRAALEAKLANSKQGRRSVLEFGDFLDGLATSLAAVHMRDSDAPSAAHSAIRQMAASHALAAFIRGVDPSLQTVLLAANPTTLPEAIRVASAATALAPTAPVNHVRFSSRGSGSRSHTSRPQFRQPNPPPFQSFSHGSPRFQPRNRPPRPRHDTYQPRRPQFQHQGYRHSYRPRAASHWPPAQQFPSHNAPVYFSQPHASFYQQQLPIHGSTSADYASGTPPPLMPDFSTYQSKTSFSGHCASPRFSHSRIRS